MGLLGCGYIGSWVHWTVGVSVHMHTHTHPHVFMHTHTHTHTYTCTHTHIHTYTHTRTHYLQTAEKKGELMPRFYLTFPGYVRFVTQYLTDGKRLASAPQSLWKTSKNFCQW